MSTSRSTDPTTHPRHLVAVLGRGVVAPDDPVVTADDLGFTRGDGCFDSAHLLTDDTGNSRVTDLAGHLERLEASAEALDIAGPDRATWEQLIAVALQAWTRPGEATVKMVLTRGREWVSGPPTALVTISSVERPSPGSGPPRGITAVTLTRGHPSDAFTDAPWLLGGVKTLSYVVNVTARRAAQAAGADDVIFTSTDGFALDGPTSALLVAQEGALLSTPLGGTGILASTSIERILRAATADRRPARYQLVRAADLYTAQGIWLVASSRGPAPVTRLNGQELSVDPALVTAVLRYSGHDHSEHHHPGHDHSGHDHPVVTRPEQRSSGGDQPLT